MPVTNVKSQWVGGNLVFYDKSMNIIATWDGTNRKLTLPSGAVLDVSGATGSISLAAGEIALADIAAASLDGTIAKVVAGSNVIGGIPVLHRVTVPGTGKAAINVTLTHQERVVDAWLVLTGAGVTGGNVTVGNAANAITDAMAATGSDTAIVRAGTIDNAYHEIAAAGTLRITPEATGADAAPCEVYVLAIRVA